MSLDLSLSLDAINMLGSQLTTLLGSLFGKRAATDMFNVNIGQVSRT